MRLVVNKEPAPLEPPTLVTLGQCDDGVMLMIDGFYILKLCNTGRVERFGGLPDSIGLILDNKHRVVDVAK